MNRADIAIEAFAQTDNDPTAAADILYKRLMSDAALHAEYAEPVLREWCTELIASVCIRSPRSSVWNATINDGSNERIKTFARSLLDFPLPGGKPLQQANKDDLNEAIAFYTKQSNDMAWKARWMAQIVNKMGRKKTVGAAFNADQLEQIKKDTELGVVQTISDNQSSADHT